MIQEGQWRGGLIPYGYRLEFQGRTNKKSQPVRDLMIDEEEGMVVREIFHLLADEGYGTNRVAQYLNDYGIKTKRGTTLWRETSIRALTGESALDLSVINTMIIKHRSRRYSAAQSMEDARTQLEREQQSSKETQAQIDEMLSWADCYDNATIATRYMIITWIVERVESRPGRKLHIIFRISLEQFLGEPT